MGEQAEGLVDRWMDESQAGVGWCGSRLASLTIRRV